MGERETTTTTREPVVLNGPSLPSGNGGPPAPVHRLKSCPLFPDLGDEADPEEPSKLCVWRGGLEGDYLGSMEAAGVDQDTLLGLFGPGRYFVQARNVEGAVLSQKSFNLRMSAAATLTQPSGGGAGADLGSALAQMTNVLERMQASTNALMERLATQQQAALQTLVSTLSTKQAEGATELAKAQVLAAAEQSKGMQALVQPLMQAVTQPHAERNTVEEFRALAEAVKALAPAPLPALPAADPLALLSKAGELIAQFGGGGGKHDEAPSVAIAREIAGAVKEVAPLASNYLSQRAQHITDLERERAAAAAATAAAAAAAAAKQPVVFVPKGALPAGSKPVQPIATPVPGPDGKPVLPAAPMPTAPVQPPSPAVVVVAPAPASSPGGFATATAPVTVTVEPPAGANGHAEVAAAEPAETPAPEPISALKEFGKLVEDAASTPERLADEFDKLIAAGALPVFIRKAFLAQAPEQFRANLASLGVLHWHEEPMRGKLLAAIELLRARPDQAGVKSEPVPVNAEAASV